MTQNIWLNANGKPYDHRPAIEAWRAGEASTAAAELWDQLYHQGTVNTASYAAASDIVRLIEELPSPDWNAYTLLAMIEEARLSGSSPSIPSVLATRYHDGWRALLSHAIDDLRKAEDDLAVRSIMAVIARAKGQHSLASLTLWTEDERQEAIQRG